MKEEYISIETLKIWQEIEKENKKLQEENKILKEKFDKAIEYIEDKFYLDKETGEYNLTHTFDKNNVYELYGILNGKEEIIKEIPQFKGTLEQLNDLLNVWR